jgi:predicted transcriptional regulator
LKAALEGPDEEKDHGRKVEFRYVTVIEHRDSFCIRNLRVFLGIRNARYSTYSHIPSERGGNWDELKECLDIQRRAVSSS